MKVLRSVPLVVLKISGWTCGLCGLLLQQLLSTTNSARNVGVPRCTVGYLTDESISNQEGTISLTTTSTVVVTVKSPIRTDAPHPLNASKIDPKIHFLFFYVLCVWFCSTRNHKIERSDRYHMILLWIHSKLNIFIDTTTSSYVTVSTVNTA